MYDLWEISKFAQIAPRPKARQKNIPKKGELAKMTRNGERLFFDISSIKSKSFGGAKFWLLVMDDKMTAHEVIF